MAGAVVAETVWISIMSAEQPQMDATRRFVRLCGERADGFVEFEFAIGEPDVFVELILHRDAFAEFCAVNAVTTLPPRDAEASGTDWDWRLSDATGIRFK